MMNVPKKANDALHLSMLEGHHVSDLHSGCTHWATILYFKTMSSTKVHVHFTWLFSLVFSISLQEKMEMLGEVLLQDSFTVWDPKGLIKKKRDYQIFLFDICILFSKQSKDSNGKNKYQFKFKMNVSATSTWMLGSNLKQLSCARILFLYVLLHVLKSTFTNLLYATTYLRLHDCTCTCK